MYLFKWPKNSLSFSLALVAGLIFLTSFTGSSAILAQDNTVYIREVRIFDPDFEMPHTAGLAFSPAASSFLVLPADQTAQPGTSNLIMITPFEDLDRSVSIAAAIANPIDITFDSRANRLLLFDAAANELIAIKAEPTGYLDPAAMTRFEAQQFGLQDPQGMTFDPATGRLFILDRAASRMVRIEPDNQHNFDGAGALAEGRVDLIDLSQLGRTDLRGLAFNPTNGHLYLLSPGQLELYEVTEAGQLVVTRNLSDLDLVFKDPQGMVFAPSSDATDNPTQMNLFLADSGLSTVLASPIRDHQIYLPFVIKQGQEIVASPDQLVAPGAPHEGNPTEQEPGRIIEFSFDDGALSASDVDPIFADSFESGSLSAWTASATDAGDLSVSAAAALIDSNGMQAVIDDNVSIYVTDDTPTAEPRYRARFYFDPNSITMASGNNHFIFYGYTGASTLVLRVQFRFSSGNYQLRANLRNDASTWTNTSWFTISNASHFIELDWWAATAAGANNGGLTLWIDGTQRANLTGTDNDTRRIDRVRLGAVAGIDAGTRGIYYFDAFESRRQSYIGPVGGAPGNAAPVVNAGPNQTITLPGSANLNGTVSDDGLPNPPGAVTTTWSQVSGPGAVTFGNPNTVNTTASFSVDGMYTLRLTADDSALSTSDEVIITVNPGGTDTVVFVGAGDIASCARVRDEETANLLDNIPGTVYTVGDNAYLNGTIDEYNNCYNPNWGRHKARTRPAVGNHDYDTAGAAGYYTYFGAAASPLDTNCTSNCKGYYSYDLGAWHIIVLNTNCTLVGGCGPTSPQGQWLQADLAANPRTCTLAITHHPLFSSINGSTSTRELWVLLYQAGVDIVLSGHMHNYERFALQNPNGGADPGRGIREFVVGTGGAGLASFGSFIAPNSEVRNSSTWGVLKLTLHPTSYDWEFIPIAGQTFTDSGSSPCVTP